MIRMQELRRKLGGVTACTIRRWVRAQTFPAPIKISYHVVLWDEAVIDDWVRAKGLPPAPV